MENPKNNALQLLRQKAEDLLIADKNSISGSPSIEVKRIIHELQLYHIELEMQNDELQQSTIELELQRLKFQNLFELAPTGYIVANKSGIIQDANFAALQLLQVQKENMLQKPFLLHIHKDDLDIFYVYFRKLLLSPESLNCQIRLVNSKRQVLNIKVEGIVLQPVKGDALCYLTLTDFTEKQQAEVKLKDAKTQLEFALNASLTGIWEIDIITGLLYLDEFCLTLYGLRDFDGKYDTFLNHIHPHDRKTVDLNIRQTIIGEKPLYTKFRVVLPDQCLRYIQGRAQVIVDNENRKRFLGTFTDISDKTLLELETIKIKEENQQMILAAGLQAEENEKKRISEVLHDGIAQMLYAIKLNMDLVKNTTDLPVFDQIAELLNTSIKDIRNIAFELAPSILTDFGLATTLEDMAARLSNSQLSIRCHVSNISKNQDFQLQLNIFRMVQELVNNAIKHAAPTKINIEVIRKNKLILITVADNGSGFENPEAGSVPKGIGLSSIKNRLRLYKGSLKIEANLKGGTMITISLKY